jgi:acetyltransferase
MLTATLKDGTRLAIRPIRPSDKDDLQRALRRLSDSSIYRRFLAPKPSFTSTELRYLTEVDGVNHHALVATPPERPDLIVAVGRWVRLQDRPGTAEAAIVVGDHLQGLGLGKQLGRLLAESAARSGIERFTATMLGSNVAAWRLLRSMTDHLDRHTAGGLTEVEWDVAA